MDSLKKEVLLKNIPFRIEEERVLRELRIPRTAHMEQEGTILRYVRKAIEKGYPLIRPAAVYRSFPLTHGKPDYGLPTSGDLFTGEKVAKILDASLYVTLLAVTIGRQISDEAEAMMKASPTDGYYLDAVGGWMADYMADRVEEKISAEAARHGCKLSMRYSPGYGDWPLSAQPPLLNLLGGERIGITLDDSHIMTPRKSVTALLGWWSEGGRH